jgi:hypothetical protein
VADLLRGAGTKTSSKPAEDVDVAARSDVNVSRLGETSDPTVLWWGMTEPLAQMKMTGAVWYQVQPHLVSRASPSLCLCLWLTRA